MWSCFRTLPPAQTCCTVFDYKCCSPNRWWRDQILACTPSFSWLQHPSQWYQVPDNCLNNSQSLQWALETTYTSAFWYGSSHRGWGGLWRGPNCRYVVYITEFLILNFTFLTGLHIAEIWTIFKLPSQLTLTYVHWFKPFNAWDSDLGMYKLSQSTRHCHPNATIICVVKSFKPATFYQSLGQEMFPTTSSTVMYLIMHLISSSTDILISI